MAISLVILVMVVMGAIDLGRAFFTSVAMNSIISEGANWGAAYPGCIPSANNTTDASQVLAGCRGTNSVLCRMMNENKDLDPARVIDLSVKPVNAQPGQVVTLSMTYRFPLITPIIQSMFGRDITLTTQVQELVRGTDAPTIPGQTGSVCNQGGVNPVTPVENLTQNPLNCTAGVATFQWTAVSGSGYHIWRSTVTSGFTGWDVPISGTGTPGTTYTWTDPIAIGGSDGAAGTRNYTITTYNTSSSGTVESTPVYFTGSCTAIQATNLVQNGCSATGVLLGWTPPTNPDLSIASYKVIDSGGNIQYTFSGSQTSSGNYVFNDPYSVTERAATIYLKAYNSSNVAIGSLVSNSIALNCPPTNAEITVTVAQSPSLVSSGNNVTYLITVTNGGPATAQTVGVIDEILATTTAPYTFVSATPSQGGACTYSSSSVPPTISCPSIGNIASGSNASISVVIQPTGTGILKTHAKATQSTTEVTTSDNEVYPSTTVNATSGVTLTMTGSPSSVAANNTSLVYSYTVGNVGPDIATGVVVTSSTLTNLTLASTTCPGTNSFASGIFTCNVSASMAVGSTSFTATFTVPATYTTPNPIVNNAALTTTSTNTSTQTTQSVSTTVTAGPIQSFAYSSCSKSSGQGKFTFTWSTYSWPGVSRYRITDATKSESWTGATGASTPMQIPTTGNLSINSYENDSYYVEALDSSGNVVGSKSSPNVTAAACG
jgi:uncharacterized repeat protein (TIGR01451 family)